MSEVTEYVGEIPRKARLRLYLNDPEIIKQILQQLAKGEVPVPVELQGELVLAEDVEKKSKCIFFKHKLKEKGKFFAPVFFDLQE
jgi:hypothetical protein